MFSFAPMYVQDPTKLSGRPLPPMSMELVKGGKLSIASLKGKVVILDFWATWCVPCVAASPTMEKLYEKYKSKGIVVVGSNLNDPLAKAIGYAKEHHYTYTFTANNLGIAQKLGISAIPVFIFVDRKGVVRRVDTGFDASSPASWEKTVKELLAS
jgi:thiol-disulfide isomerase/thioredoxin